MTKLKVLSVAAALALVLPIATSGASYAQEGPRGGGAGMRAGGGGGGGGFRAGPIGGGGFRAGPPMNAPAIVGGKFAGGPAYAGGGPRHFGGGPRHFGPRPGYGGGFWPGIAAGAVIGGALAAGSYYSPYYYNSYGYYDDGYYDDSAVAPYGDDAIAYCIRRFKSYDPASGTYLGYDGFRHPCP